LIAAILSWLASLIIKVISDTGYWGITFFMTLESMGLPIPSEIVMPFSGYLVTMDRFSLSEVVFCATLGNLIGSLIFYAIGYWGGRPLVEKYGRFVLISEAEISRANNWFKKNGSVAIFFSRLLPVVRTYISLPAGIAKMNLPKFVFYTSVGSVPWNFGLAYIGFVLAEEWGSIEKYFRQFDFLILALIIIGMIWFFKKHFAKNKKE